MPLQYQQGGPVKKVAAPAPPPAQPPEVGGSDPGTQASPTAPKPGLDLSTIPNSSTYLGETAAANAAYEKAKSQLLANRNSLYHQYGLTDTGGVDINNPYGEYQMLLGSEGNALDSARNDGIARGLGSGGLANQGEASLIPGQRLEQLGFQHSVDDVGAQYAQGMLGAENDRTGSINQAYQDALAEALAKGLFDSTPPPGGSGGDGGGGTGGGSTPPKTNTAPKVSQYKPYAVKVTANKTGASANKRQGIFSIH